MRKNFEMSEEQMNKILEASKPIPYIIVGGIGPPSQQEMANSAWEKLGKEMGFKYMTVKALKSGNNRMFSAEEIT